jgi:hypothetical protein
MPPSPKTISGRTSYLPVRLEFLPYPQLITGSCNIRVFGPPSHSRGTSSWPWVDHRVSGLVHDTYRPIQARFHYGSGYYSLSLSRRTANSMVRSPISTQSPRRAPTPCKQRISDTISSPSRGAFHLSLAVLVHYRSLNLFSLGKWSSQIQAGLHVSDPT